MHFTKKVDPSPRYSETGYYSPPPSQSCICVFIIFLKCVFYLIASFMQSFLQVGSGVISKEGRAPLPTAHQRPTWSHISCATGCWECQTRTTKLLAWTSKFGFNTSRAVAGTTAIIEEKAIHQPILFAHGGNWYSPSLAGIKSTCSLNVSQIWCHFQLLPRRPPKCKRGEKGRQSAMWIPSKLLLS